MGWMFYGASRFNQPLNDWNVSKTYLAFMFADATSFNQPLNNWNVSNVTRMTWMPSGLVNEITNYHPLLCTRGPRWT